MTDEAPPLTTVAASRRLGCSCRTVVREIARGRLQAFRVGSDWRVPVAALEAFLRAREEQCAPSAAIAAPSSPPALETSAVVAVVEALLDVVTRRDAQVLALGGKPPLSIPDRRALESANALLVAARKDRAPLYEPNAQLRRQGP